MRHIKWRYALSYHIFYTAGHRDITMNINRMKMWGGEYTVIFD